MPRKNILNIGLTQDFLAKIAGQYAVELARICQKKGKHITDEQIGKKLPLKVTEIRTVLNRLHYRGIACYTKTRNNKTGWYSYTWEIKEKRVAELIIEEMAEEKQRLEQAAAFEEDHTFFKSAKTGEAFPFEIAAEYGFKCPETGTPLQSIDNKKRVRGLNKKIKGINDDLQELEKFL